MNTFLVTHLESDDTLYLDMSYKQGVNFCTRNKHTVFERKLLIDFRNGTSFFFDGRHCVDCNRIYVERNYYADTINTSGEHDLNIEIVLPNGTLLSDAKDESQPLHPKKEFPERAERSLLNKRGYNVGLTDNLSDRERQEILKGIIESGELTQGYICSHLKYLIKINGKKYANWFAVQKWKRDLEYVQQLKPQKKTMTLEEFLNIDTKEIDDELPIFEIDDDELPF